MEDIFDIKTEFEIKDSAAPEGEVVFHIADEPSALLRDAGDMTVNTDGGKTNVTVYTGGAKAKDRWRKTGGRIASWIKSKCPASAALDLSGAEERETLVGLFLGAYEFSRYKKPADKHAGALEVKADENAFNEVKTICAAANMTRDWAHEPACVINPWTLSDRCAAFAKKYGLKCTVLDDKQLSEMGAGAIVAVGQGSKTPSRMIILEYAGSGEGKPVALVGKSLTFDAGGYSLKPPASMKGMKYDKCGAMAVLGILRAAAELKLKTPLVGVICAAENMVSDKSYRVDDIVTSLSGKTIEITNTDAEGRLVLADGLTYVQRNYSPRCVLNYCTLTGACVVAFGRVRAGVMCTDDALFDALNTSAEQTHELIWRLPDDSDYLENLKSHEADLANSGGREGGLCAAGLFLKSFIDEGMPWAHFDIAGMADSDKGSPYLVPGATGFGVRLTVDWLRGLE